MERAATKARERRRSHTHTPLLLPEDPFPSFLSPPPPPKPHIHTTEEDALDSIDPTKTPKLWVALLGGW